jgi:isoquinoline 1-oxidoreductase subunit beta
MPNRGSRNWNTDKVLCARDDVRCSSRRAFLKHLAGGGLLLGIYAPLAGGHKVAEPPSASPSMINGWVRISLNGDVVILTNASEIGQGTGTAIAQILADELDLEWHNVRLEMAPMEPRYFNPKWGEYATYGSAGIRGQFDALRLTGAQARAMLIAAAADGWRVPVTACDTENGQVVHRPTGRRLSYGKLASAAARQQVLPNARLKSPTQWRLIGKNVPRLDIPSKVNGSAIYGIDISFPGLRIAAILQSPRFGGRLARVDPGPALAVPGVLRVVSIGDAVAVVASDYWTASKGLARLEPIWDNSAASTANSTEYEQALRDAARAGGTLFVPAGSTADGLTREYAQAIGGAMSRYDAIYTVPFLSHAPMEPMNATAIVSESKAELWLPTQNPSAAAAALAADLGLPQAAITIHTTLSGGGFGRRVEFDYALQVVRIAKVMGEPVKLIWSREEDMRHDFYRPAAAVRLSAGIGADRLPVCLRFDSACESLLYYSGGGNRAAALPVDRSALGTPPSFYAITPMLFTVNTVDVGVPVGYWRSVAASQNVFAYESFFDELAHLAGIDSAEWRRKMVANGSRARRVLDTVLERAKWYDRSAAGRFRGLALVNVNGSFVAHVVELSLKDGSAIQLHQITTAIDCGVAVNPYNIRAQIEGSIAFALSAAMYGEITIDNGAVKQSNFNNYRVIRLSEMPPVDIVILSSSETPGGVGEEAVSALAPALTNALFAATGRRVRDLPLVRAGFSLASHRISQGRANPVSKT